MVCQSWNVSKRRPARSGPPSPVGWLTVGLWIVLGGWTAGGILLADDSESRGEALRRLALADRQGDGDELLRQADALLSQDAQAAEAYYWRGRERFRRGDVERSVEDFDRYVELRPEREPPQWERGIALYYAGQFQRGARQFELYQSYDNRDVENSVGMRWLRWYDSLDQASIVFLELELDLHQVGADVSDLGKDTAGDA